MHYVKFVKRGSKDAFEREINEALKENEHADLIDIKHSSTLNNDTPIYSAVIIFKSK
jgi:hypothetical protein